MIGFLFFLALQPISRKTECRINLRYVQEVYTKIPVSLAAEKKEFHPIIEN